MRGVHGPGAAAIVAVMQLLLLLLMLGVGGRVCAACAPTGLDVDCQSNSLGCCDANAVCQDDGSCLCDEDLTCINGACQAVPTVDTFPALEGELQRKIVSAPSGDFLVVENEDGWWVLTPDGLIFQLSPDGSPIMASDLPDSKGRAVNVDSSVGPEVVCVSLPVLGARRRRRRMRRQRRRLGGNAKRNSRSSSDGQGSSSSSSSDDQEEAGEQDVESCLYGAVDVLCPDGAGGLDLMCNVLALCGSLCNVLAVACTITEIAVCEAAVDYCGGFRRAKEVGVHMTAACMLLPVWMAMTLG